MPPEIADSDAESDIVVHEPRTRRESPPPTRHNGTTEQCSPTQRLSELASSTSKGTGSTDRLIRGLLPASYDGLSDPVQPTPATHNATKKRGASEVQTPTAAGINGPPKKRNKTYGSKANNPSFDPFADLQSADLDSTGAPLEGMMSERSPEIPLEIVATEARERNRPRRVVSLLDPNFANHQITTSMASMGSHQSINLNFRDDGMGVGVDANPFGSVSQISVDGPQSQAAHQDANGTSQDQQLFDLFDQLAQPTAQSQMMTSPNRPASPTAPAVEPLSEGEGDPPVVPPPLAESVGSDNLRWSAKRRKTDLSPSRSIRDDSVRRSVSVSAETPSRNIDAVIPKKRGRPAKKKQQSDVDLDELHMPMGPPALHKQREPRPGIELPELSSQTSHLSQSTSNTGKKRRHSQSQVEPSKEQPKQHPSSELNLSDEQFIGLPKENYKPRPSRSRSKPDDNDEGMLPPATTPSQRLKAATPVRDSSEAPASRSSTSKAKKSKVKRAKTSGAALLKASEPMISDGEDNVLWLETKPAAVKLDLPPNLDLLKKGPLDDEQDSADELHLDQGKKSHVFLGVEIPVHADGQSDGSSDKKTSKKRGRKSQKAKAAPAGDTIEVVAPKPDRAVLAEKNTNARDTSKSKKVAKSKALITESDDEEGEISVSVVTETVSPTKKASQDDPVRTDTDSASVSVSAQGQIAAKTPSPVKVAAMEKPTHSPLKSTLSSASSTQKQRYRVGLSKRNKIPSLLRKVQRDKPPPSKTGIKIKELKVKGFNDGGEDAGEGDGAGEGANAEGGKWDGVLRDKDGRLVEWDF